MRAKCHDDRFFSKRSIRGLKATAKFTATLSVATYSWREPISIARLISVVENALKR
ncbi:MAG: hypothetical protein QOE77_1709 [Blastocatellia bacterium]|jgi:hypothetical protein|nr:hypothetical protein [Blastocatellia bacterium]